jgi:hypothetical protein
MPKRPDHRSVSKMTARAVAIAAGVGLAISLVACGTDKDRPAGFDDTYPPNGRDASVTTGDFCATPGHEGCPCDEEGASVECGNVVEKKGDYTTCSMGHSWCDGQAWGACIGNHFVMKSTGTGNGLHPLASNVPCANVCDPNACQSIQNTGNDIDASGLMITDAGVTLQQGEAAAPGGACKGLQCSIVSCDGGPKTSISGTVYDPAGKVPLYNAFVFIPSDAAAPLPAFTTGVSCDTCAGANIAAVALAQTGPDGKFKLDNAPAGANIPLVVQMGKWRRKVILPAVTACKDNALDKQYTHLPKNHTDGAGNVADIPKMAIASGSADPFECLLVKAGVDPAEIDVPSKGVRVDYYVFNGRDRFPGGAPAGTTLTSDVNALNKYDVVLLPCEGKEIDSHGTEIPNLVKYTAAGGRIFTTHYGYSWLASPNAGVAQNLTEYYQTASWKLNTKDYDDPTAAVVDQSFPKGIAYAQWLQNVNGGALGQISLNEPRHDALSATTASQRWIYGWHSGLDHAKPADMLLSMTFNTPVGVAANKQCGRVVYSDFHVSADALTDSDGDCKADSDCGFGATCQLPVMGTCTDQTCMQDVDCDTASAYKCKGVVKGACTMAPCTGTNTGTCISGKCSGGPVCKCSSNSHCNPSGCDTTTKVCKAGSCATNDDCGGAEVCSGATPGVCQRACTTNADCADSLCKGGLCVGCYADWDCHGSSASCVGAIPGAGCTLTSNMFPLSCRNADLSPQEKALEFMLFDLTACVSPDSYAPPAPTVAYSPVTFTQDFTAVCGKGQLPVWREFDWQAQIPSTASIAFSAQTAGTTAALATAKSVPITTTTTTTMIPNWDVGLLDTGSGGVFRAASPPIPSETMLRVTITLNPSSDAKAAPVLNQWKVQFDCVDAQ